MRGLKFYTDQECGHTGQPSAVSERSSSDDGVGPNMTSKNGPNVAARSLLYLLFFFFELLFKSSSPARASLDTAPRAKHTGHWPTKQ
jgi:hypothetical protein